RPASRERDPRPVGTFANFNPAEYGWVCFLLSFGASRAHALEFPSSPCHAKLLRKLTRLLLPLAPIPLRKLRRLFRRNRGPRCAPVLRALEWKRGSITAPLPASSTKSLI